MVEIITEALDLLDLGRRAKAAGRLLALAPTAQKDAALAALADRLVEQAPIILEANAQDMADGRANGLSEALLDRLLLNEKRLASIAADVRTVIDLPDPVGEVFDEAVRPNGLKVFKKRVPFGVLGVIYEARPNVTIDIAALALKSGNAAILRGGKETLRSNMALVRVISQALAENGLPLDAFLYVEDTDRRYILELLRLNKYVDVIIPRGGAGLHQFCLENATVPVITGGVGICHLFVDESAPPDMALDVIYNAKTSRPSVCNSLDTALVHSTVAESFIPRLVDRLASAGVSFRADERAMQMLAGRSDVQPAGPDDWDTEWMALILGIKVVDSLQEAVDHIEEHSLHHSDGILTQDEANAWKFIDMVDSSAVFVNASTRFNDGGQFGLGAEVAVSTQKLHARGPMGLKELTTYKWVAVGTGQVR